MSENNMREFNNEFEDMDGDGMSVTLDTDGTVCELSVYSACGCFPMDDPDEVQRLGELLISHAKYMRSETVE